MFDDPVLSLHSHSERFRPTPPELDRAIRLANNGIAMAALGKLVADYRAGPHIDNGSWAADPPHAPGRVAVRLVPTGRKLDSGARALSAAQIVSRPTPAPFHAIQGSLGMVCCPTNQKLAPASSARIRSHVARGLDRIAVMAM